VPPGTASRCKARAAETATKIARESIQLHGAIGFSDEADVGLYVRRAMTLAAWMGGADAHRRHFAAVSPYAFD
jgi:alkylation response protein AidB-like acyl-CoA dehydrogenase